MLHCMQEGHACNKPVVRTVYTALLVASYDTHKGISKVSQGHRLLYEATAQHCIQMYTHIRDLLFKVNVVFCTHVLE